MKPNIIVVGSLNMDLVVSADRMPRTGETIHGTDIHYVPGGKGANQAVGCARLGCTVELIGAVGNDVFAQQIVRSLSNDDVQTRYVAQLDGVATGIASITHTKDDNCIVIVPGANGHCSPELVTGHQAAIEGADLLLVQLEIPLETVHCALRIARQAGVPTVLNPAPASRIPKELLQLADYLTPNETEFETLSGKSGHTDESLEQSMRDWEAEFGHKLIITRGDKGCSYLQHERLRTVPAPRVEVVDTTGAGDAFNAALACGIANGWETERCIRFAVKAASLSVTKFGAQSGMPMWQEVAGSMTDS